MYNSVLRTGGYPSTYRSMNLSSGANVKNQPALLFSISCFNTNSAIRYFQLFDSVVAPTGTPVISYPIFGNAFLILDKGYFTEEGIAFETGLTWGISTTFGTYTPATPSETSAEILYR